MNRFFLSAMLVLTFTVGYAADVTPKLPDPANAPVQTDPNTVHIVISQATPTTVPASAQAATVAPVIVPTVVQPEPSLFQKIVTGALVALGGLFTAGTGLFFNWVVGKVKASDAQKAAIDALHAGVDQTYLTMYNQFKDAAADGKISAAEAAQLRQNAITQAMTLAKGPGLEFLKAMAIPMVESLVQRIVSAKKAASAASTVVPIANPVPTA